MANGAGSPEDDARASTLRPPVLDCGGDLSEETAAPIRAALSSALSPTVALQGHGLEARCAAVAAAADAAHSLSGDRQEAFSLDAAADAASLKRDLVALARRAVEALAPEFPKTAALDARFSMRRYPAMGGTKAAGQRLGAHVDNTLCTLLWSTGPGLEVLAPRTDDAKWTGEDVRQIGLPMMGAAEEPRVAGDDDWAVVDLAPWDRGAILLTPGQEWTRCAHTNDAVPLRSPTLHRVVLPSGKARLSLPLLVSLAAE